MSTSSSSVTLLVAAAVVGLAVFYMRNQAQPDTASADASSTDAGASDSSGPDTSDDPTDPGTPAADQSNTSTIDAIVTLAKSALGIWAPPAAYADLIAQTETQNDIPENMLARLLYQECHWRDDIITGATRSSAGALGIAQFMPKTAAQLGIDPLNPAEAIPAAGKYLARLFWKFGTWGQALAAYNWGEGNVSRKGMAAAPTETRNYVAQILADVNAANSSSYA